MGGHLDEYKEGWRTGNAAMILRAIADDFVYDDPVDGCFTKMEFAAYLEKLFANDEASSGTSEGFETHTEEVMQAKDGQVTAWVWFKTATTEGATLKKAGPDGVRLERLVYYTRPGSASTRVD
jgi:hypothetical protein